MFYYYKSTTSKPMSHTYNYHHKSNQMVTYPNIFHSPRKPFSFYFSSRVSRKLINTASRHIKLFNWNRPVLFIKKTRSVFLFYFFLKKNIKSLSFIFSNLKRHSYSTIYSFFFKTTGFLINLFFSNAGMLRTGTVYLNGFPITSNWLLVPKFCNLQVKVHLNFSKKKFKFLKKEKFSLPNFTTILGTLSFKGFFDKRTGILVPMITECNSSKNLFNFDNPSIYNWKIII